MVVRAREWLAAPSDLDWAEIGRLNGDLGSIPSQAGGLRRLCDSGAIANLSQQGPASLRLARNADRLDVRISEVLNAGFNSDREV